MVVEVLYEKGISPPFCGSIFPLNKKSVKNSMASFIKIYDNNPSPREIERVVDILRQGGLIIYPTDTLYAIACDAMNTRSVEKICQIKGINPDKSRLAIVCCDLSNISEYAKVDNATFKLMKRNLPGAFTFILNVTSQLPRIYKKRKTVGIRVPNNSIAYEIVKTLGNPLMTTSLPIHEEVEYMTDPELIYEKYQHMVSCVVDGGYGGIEPSTIVDCTSDTPEVVRQGKGVLMQ